MLGEDFVGVVNPEPMSHQVQVGHFLFLGSVCLGWSVVEVVNEQVLSGLRRQHLACGGVLENEFYEFRFVHRRSPHLHQCVAESTVVGVTHATVVLLERDVHPPFNRVGTVNVVGEEERTALAVTHRRTPEESG